MKTKVGAVILVAACIVLVGALWVTQREAYEDKKTDTVAILDFSNQLVTARHDIDELGQVNLKLTNELAASRQETLTFSNQVVETSSALADTKTSLQSAQDQITNLSSHVANLEAENQELDQRAARLTNALASLNEQIAETQQKLADSQTNNAFLEKELQQQMAARAELEAKFNNLTAVRAQARKLRDDMVIARRLRWMREGTDPTRQIKGAELLLQRSSPYVAPPPEHYDLNVEIGSDGSIHVIPPSTNTPAAPQAPQ
jgi:chromosome segregation ATPase